MSSHRIEIKTYSENYEEAVSGGTITPGMLVARNSAGAFIAQDSASIDCERMFAIEDELKGSGISVDYTSGNRVKVLHAYSGDVINALFTAGSDIIVGDLLEATGDGTLKEYSSGTKLAIAMEDTKVSGLTDKTAVAASTTTTLPTCTYDNGTLGVGATLTADADGALVAQDGVTIVDDDRLLVKNQAAGLQNGTYVATSAGVTEVVASISDVITFGTPANGDTVVFTDLPDGDETFTMSTLTAATPSGTITFGSPSNGSTVVMTGLPDGDETFTKVAPEAIAVPSDVLTFGTPANGDTVVLTDLPTDGTATFTMSALTTATISDTITFGSPSNGSTVVFTDLPTDGTATHTKVDAEATASISGTLTYGAPSTDDTLIFTDLPTDGTVTFTKKPSEATASPSGTITYGSPSNLDTVVFTDLPTDGTVTFTKAAAGSATEFSSISELTALIEALTDLNATDNGTVITLAPQTSGTAFNSATVTGTGAYVGLNVTFSGGEAALGATEFDTITALTALIQALTDLNATDDGSIITMVPQTSGVAFNSATVTGTGAYVAISLTFSGGVDAPGANEFATIAQLTALIQAFTDLNATDNGTVITIVPVTAGAGLNSATVTGTTSFSALSLTFSGGYDAPGANEFDDISGLKTLINNLTDLNATDDSTDITIVGQTTGVAFNSATVTGTGSYAALSITFSGGVDAPGTDEFATIAQLTALIQALTDLNATDNGTVITLVVATAGTAMNSATVTGTTSYSALSLTFSGGYDAPGADEFEDITGLTALIQALTDLNATDDGSDITISPVTAGVGLNIATVTGTGSYSALSLTFSGGVDGAPFVLTRATNQDTTLEFVNTYVTITAGSTLIGKRWYCSNTVAPTVGTTAITFAAFASTASTHYAVKIL